MSKKAVRVITKEEELTLKLMGQAKEVVKLFFMIQLAILVILLVGYVVYSLIGFFTGLKKIELICFTLGWLLTTAFGFSAHHDYLAKEAAKVSD